MLRKPLTIGIATLTLASMLTSCSGTSTSNNQSDHGSHEGNSQTAKTTYSAEELYKSNCVSCHGTDLKGRLGPNLQKVGSDLAKEQITTKITKGGGGMPPFERSLDADQIETLAKWLAGKK